MPAPRDMQKVEEEGEGSDSDDVADEHYDVEGDYDTTETIGDELVAAWGMREEPSESEDDDNVEISEVEDEAAEVKSRGDLEDVVDMSLERIDEDMFEEYEDDNLKVEGQVSNRRVDLGGEAEMERVREPWPTKSRQQLQQLEGEGQLQPEAQRRTQMHFKKRIIATAPVLALQSQVRKGQYQGHHHHSPPPPPRSRDPMQWKILARKWLLIQFWACGMLIHPILNISLVYGI